MWNRNRGAGNAKDRNTGMQEEGVDVPLPPRLKVILEDHPEILLELQNELNWAAQSRSLTPPFVLALWRLEDILSHHMLNARAALREAEARGNADEIEAARKTYEQMRRARSLNIGLSNLDELWDFLSKKSQ